MKALLDINVLLDAFLVRKDHEEASLILDLASRRSFRAYVSAHAITTLSYFLEKDPKFRGTYRENIRFLFRMTDILAVDRIVLEDALTSAMDDFEDAVLEAVATHAGLDCIVTRNVSDFTRSRVAALTPAKFLKALDSDSKNTSVREPAPAYHTRPRRRRKVAAAKAG